ncbi:MAG: lactonase family protein [Planctomycetaceae bacterium]|nr:lactonase family protein [Planctomycetaceae bacterium]
MTMTRSDLGRLLGWVVLLVGAQATAAPAEKNVADQSPIRVYFGTYTGGDSKGIYFAELDRKTGEISAPRLAAEAVNPSFLAIHPTQKFLYAVGEVSDFNGKKSGGVSAFAIDPQSGALRLINQHPSGGAGPCHLTVDATGRDVLVANYGGGSVACLPIQSDGSLKPPSSFVQHAGSSVNPQRQAGPHAHSINLDANNRFAIAADLGLDKLLVYRFDAERGTLEPNDPPAVALPAGGGPRHFAFHPTGKFAYACNEMLSTVSALAYDPEKGVLTELQTISTLPEGGHAGNSTAEVRVHPSGEFVYVSNRGHNSIAMFAVDAQSGKLTPLGQESTRGQVPRNFNIDPSGRYLLAANQDSANVVVFAIDPAKGTLRPTGSEIQVSRPVCVRFHDLP